MKWANRNLGANVPEGTGLYFSWGNTDGHPLGGGYNFSQSQYDASPAASISDNLTLDHDAARINLGAPWRMPSNTDYQELYNNCSRVWTSINGVAGHLFTSNINGKTIFFPASGHYNDTSLTEKNTAGDYWTSVFFSPTAARSFSFTPTNVNPNSNSPRRYGFAIRAVQDGTPNRSVDPPTPEV